MNLKFLFDIQKVLDDRIVKEKGLEGRDLLPQKILALQVELGELANEQRSWKFWSNDKEPRTKIECETCEGLGYTIELWGKDHCEECNGTGVIKNPLLEEYVDCLHFILSIGNDLHHYNDKTDLDYPSDYDKELDYFHYLISTYADLWNYGEIEDPYGKVIRQFITLGSMLGFTWQEIEQAYLDKNKINHERQNNGY